MDTTLPYHELNRMGATLFLVNSDKTILPIIDERSTYEAVKETIEEILENYRNTIYYQYITESSSYYKPLNRKVFGLFDQLFLYCHDDYELNNLYLQPQSTLLENNNILFDYKSITGNFILGPKETSKGYFERLENAIQKKEYFFLTRIKINAFHLFKGAGKSGSMIKKEIRANFNKHKNEDKINHPNGSEKQSDELFIMESFGFHEIVLLSFWKDWEDAVQFLLESRELNVTQLSERRKKDSHVWDQNSRHAFDLFSSTMGVSDAVFKSEEFQNSRLNFTSVFGLKPGYANQFLEVNKEFGLFKPENEAAEQAKKSTSKASKIVNFLLGWQDVTIGNLYKKLQKADSIYQYFNKIKPFIDNSRTLVSYTPSNEIPNNRDNYDSFLLQNMIIESNQIKETYNRLKEMGINLVVIQRCINSILNFNKSITERENFSFFLQLRDYLEVNLIGFVKAYHRLYHYQLENITEKDFFSTDFLEDELIKNIKGFETSFTNRYIHSKELSEITDTNYAYKGGIHQYLHLYSYLFTSMYQAVYDLERPGVSLYVTGYSQTVSWEYNIRMNIFQVNNPGLFLVVLTHEVVIHIFEKLLKGCFFYHHGLQDDKGHAEKRLIDLYRKTGKSKKEFLSCMKNLGFNNTRSPYFNILFEAETFDQTPEEPILERKEQEILQYLLTDMVTLSVTFLEDIELFIYWHLVYFLHAYGSKREDYQGNLTSLVERFYLLICYHQKNQGVDEVDLHKKATLDLRRIYRMCLPNEPLPVNLGKAINHAQSTLIAAENKGLLDFLHCIHKCIINNFLGENIGDLRTELDYAHQLPVIHPNIHNDSREERADRVCTQRKLSYAYLKYFARNFPKIEILNERSNFVEYEDDNNESPIIIGCNGDLQVKGDKNRERAFSARINYLSNMWHLGHLHNHRLVENLTKSKELI